MITYPAIDPVMVSLGPIKVHWYGVMYLVAFGTAWWLGKRRALKTNGMIAPQQVDDVIFYGAIGVVVGGRVGSVIFYNFDSFIENTI